MPALTMFGRSWLVAADDLPVSMMCLMVVHAGWYAACFLLAHVCSLCTVSAQVRGCFVRLRTRSPRSRKSLPSRQCGFNLVIWHFSMFFPVHVPRGPHLEARTKGHDSPACKKAPCVHLSVSPFHCDYRRHLLHYTRYIFRLSHW